MSVYDPDSANLTTWSALVEKQSKGLSPDDFTWHTPEGIPLKTLYTAEDTEQLPYTNTMPGLSPYIRGPQSTMYAGRRWTHQTICRLFDGGSIQCVLPKVTGCGRARYFRRI